jgi:hypothetical protein
VPDFWWFGEGTEHPRVHWRLCVRLPDLDDENTRQILLWTKQHLIPACLASPVDTTLVFEPPGDVRD